MATPTLLPDYLSTSQVARKLDCSYQHALRLLTAGKIAGAARTSWGQRVAPVASVEQYDRQRRAGRRAQEGD